jgi:hypothetical protein
VGVIGFAAPTIAGLPVVTEPLLGGVLPPRMEFAAPWRSPRSTSVAYRWRREPDQRLRLLRPDDVRSRAA